MSNQPTNQPTKDLTEGGDLREGQVAPSVCIAIPVFMALLAH
jgi:hypothetical protein